ncbi:MAG: peptidoglycan editing factor PgeF [Bacteroidales bacterium]
MHPQDLGTTTIYSFDKLSEFDTIKHFVSTRKGGISQGHFSSLNIGFHVGDNNFRVLQNRRALADALDLDLLSFTMANQTHSGNVNIVGASNRGSGAVDKESALANTDGMITNVPNICLGVQVADCVPVLLYDPVKKVIAALHAGWRGTLRKIIPKAIDKMLQHYDCRTDNILACLGPSNGPCCYEVGDDVFREARITLGSVKDIIKPAKTPGKHIFDQWEANKQQLLDCGIKEEHIEQADICTQCNHDNFYSSRTDQGVTGRFLAGIMLKKG